MQRKLSFYLIFFLLATIFSNNFSASLADAIRDRTASSLLNPLSLSSVGISLSNETWLVCKQFEYEGSVFSPGDTLSSVFGKRIVSRMNLYGLVSEFGPIDKKNVRRFAKHSKKSLVQQFGFVEVDEGTMREVVVCWFQR